MSPEIYSGHGSSFPRPRTQSDLGPNSQQQPLAPSCSPNQHTLFARESCTRQDEDQVQGLLLQRTKTSVVALPHTVALVWEERRSPPHSSAGQSRASGYSGRAPSDVAAAGRAKPTNGDAGLPVPPSLPRSFPTPCGRNALHPYKPLPARSSPSLELLPHRPFLHTPLPPHHSSQHVPLPMPRTPPSPSCCFLALLPYPLPASPLSVLLPLPRTPPPPSSSHPSYRAPPLP